MVKSLELRLALGSAVGLAVAASENDPDPVSLFLLARLLKLPERLVWKPRRGLVWRTALILRELTTAGSSRS